VRKSSGKRRARQCLPVLYLDEHLYFNGFSRYVSVCGSFGYKVFCLVKLYFYLFAGSLSVPMADTLVEDPDKDG
jgi:hypothetical protein